MDVSEYLPMFLAEGREHLQELNLSVVRIEENPDDPDTVDEIFRIAHSLKGMSATMGFAGMAALTHEMEDVFELLRQRKDGLGRDAVTVLLRCLDALSEAVDAIEADGTEQILPEPLIAELRDLVRDRTPDQSADRTGDPAEAAAPALEAVGDLRVVRIDVQLAEDVQMPAVRAYMVLSAIAEKGEIVSSAPMPDKVDAFAGRDVHIWLATEEREDALIALAASVPDVAAVQAAVAVPAGEAEAEAEAAEQSATPGAPAASKPKGASTVRIDAERLDQLMHHMGELVLHRTQVEGLAAQADVPGLAQAMQNLTRTSHALQQMVMQVRMIPVEAVFLRFPRLVRDLSTKLDKQVDLKLVGKDTELDRTVVDALGDPLVHLVRNSLDHGLEAPDVRRAAGKPATGTLEISARHAGGNVIISVRDDGAGIDPAMVARKAAERGLIPADTVDTVDAKGAAELLFHPGFSTAEVTSDISGRGVGMDAVRTDRARARRRGAAAVRARGRHDRADPPAADARHRGHDAGRDRRPPVRRADRPDRAHGAAGRPHGPLGRRREDARDARQRAADRRRRGAPPPHPDAGRRPRRDRPQRGPADGPVRHPPCGPARAGHPPPARRGVRRRGPDRRRRAGRRPDCPDRGLRCARRGRRAARALPRPRRVTLNREEPP